MWQGWLRDTLIAFFKIHNTLFVNKKVDGLCGITSENDISIIEHINKICYFFLTNSYSFIVFAL
jgi:hypothetical protein